MKFIDVLPDKAMLIRRRLKNIFCSFYLAGIEFNSRITAFLWKQRQKFHLEQEEKDFRRPDFTPIWENETFHRERDFRMGTKLPYLFKKCGMKNIEARISDNCFSLEAAAEISFPKNHIHIQNQGCPLAGSASTHHLPEKKNSRHSSGKTESICRILLIFQD